MSDARRYDVIQSQGHEKFFDFLQFSKSISSGIFNVSWLANDHWFWNYGTISNFYTGQIFDICPSFCVTWLRTWNGVTLIQFANAFAIAITFDSWRRRSEATAVTYGTNFLLLLMMNGLEWRCREYELGQFTSAGWQFSSLCLPSQRECRPAGCHNALWF